MKIMYCINSIVKRAGMESIVYYKAESLVSDYQYSVVIVTTDQKNRNVCFPRIEGISYIDLNINYEDIFSKRPSIKKYIELVQKLNLHQKELAVQIRKEKPDVIVSVGGCDEWLLPKIHGDIPIVNECHFHKTFRLDKTKTIYEKIRQWANIQLKRKYDVFVTLTKVDLMAWNLSNAICIPNFSIFNNERKICNSAAHKIIAVGRLEDQKGFDYLVQIWRMVVQDSHYDESWDLYICGEGSKRESLENQILDNDLQDSVHLLGNVDNILNEYMKSSIQVMTSRYEGFPLALIEGMSCGLVPISFDCKQGPAEIITCESGILVEPGNLEKFKDELLMLMNNEDVREKYSKVAIRRSKSFSKDIIMEEWNNLFLTLSEKVKDLDV